MMDRCDIMSLTHLLTSMVPSCVYAVTQEFRAHSHAVLAFHCSVGEVVGSHTLLAGPGP